MGCRYWTVRTSGEGLFYSVSKWTNSAKRLMAPRTVGFPLIFGTLPVAQDIGIETRSLRLSPLGLSAKKGLVYG